MSGAPRRPDRDDPGLLSDEPAVSEPLVDEAAVEGLYQGRKYNDMQVPPGRPLRPAIADGRAN